ncbi:unnamed protein product [Psylliodes chrysocephalus]|uniref:Uncharacterized protein n=1 Tax=Psylliodes chrysocephalus TaxID=3402493 RepID=A0A9P0G967_9CUCU|nr:unnamed protein product [Psylliodes chrysocephala]
MKLSSLFLFALFGFVVGVAIEKPIKSNFYHEETCKGGYCLLENECGHDVEVEHKDLCPGQKKLGAVCCKGFPADKVNCFQTHNTCMAVKTCPENLNSGRKGCPCGETCCVLV